MNDCIFCKIIAGELPKYPVYEDDRVLAFLDIHPQAKGHTLVIPKFHADTLLDLDESYFADLLSGVKKVQEKMLTVLQPDGFNIVWSHGEAAGQEVHHLHLHVIPRWEGDTGTNIHALVNDPGDMNLEEVGALFA